MLNLAKQPSDQPSDATLVAPNPVDRFRHLAHDPEAGSLLAVLRECVERREFENSKMACWQERICPSSGPNIPLIVKYLSSTSMDCQLLLDPPAQKDNFAAALLSEKPISIQLSCVTSEGEHRRIRLLLHHSGDRYSDTIHFTSKLKYKETWHGDMCLESEPLPEPKTNTSKLESILETLTKPHLLVCRIWVENSRHRLHPFNERDSLTNGPFRYDFYNILSWGRPFSTPPPALVKVSETYINKHLIHDPDTRDQELFEKFNKQKHLHIPTSEIDHSISILIRSFELYQAGILPQIEKQNNNYFLIMPNYGEVFRIGDHAVEYLVSRAKSKPLGIVEHTYVSRFGYMVPGIGLYDYVTSDGVKLIGPARDFAANLFQKVQKSHIILPAPETPLTYRDKTPPTTPSESSPELRPRHWGQEYLESRSYTRKTQGSVFASGQDSIAYEFSKYVIVESNFESQATYVFERDKFSDILAERRTRSQVLDENPAGYVDRIIHRGEGPELRAEWKAKIDQYL